jgi:N-acetylmuramoyl-L-alanine amidase CwlA
MQMCWHAGDGIGGGNSSSIGIEICVNDRNGFIDACDKAAWLTAELLKRHKLNIDKVVQHNRWSGKNCSMELRNSTWGISWVDFIARINQFMNEASVSPLEPSVSTSASTTAKPMYRVQVGAYSVKSNADAMLAKVKAAGFSDAYIKAE